MVARVDLIRSNWPIMTTDLLDFVLARLDARDQPWTEIARCSGVPYSTLKKIAARITPNPGVQHVQRLANYFEGAPQGAATSAQSAGESANA